MRTLVLGGYGAVGARIVAQLRANADVALAAGRDAAPADRVVDLREAGSDALRAALSDVEVVVNAAGLEDPTLAALITGHGVAFVDITASAGYVARSTTSGYIPWKTSPRMAGCPFRTGAICSTPTIWSRSSTRCCVESERRASG